MKILSNNEAKYLNDFQIRNCIIIPMQLPFELRGQFKDLHLKINNFPIIQNIKRRVVFTYANRLLKEQEMNPHHDSGFLSVDLSQEENKFSYTVSKLNCFISVEDDEIDELEKIIQDEDFIFGLTQKMLEIFFYDYNCENLSTEFKNPNLLNVTPLSIHLSTNNARMNGTEKFWGLRKLMPKANINKLPYAFTINEVIYTNWVYFFSKAINDYKFSYFYDSIINCAISFEAYFHYLVSTKKLSENYIKEKNGDFRRATNIINLIYQDKHLNITNLKKDNLDEIKMKILNNRNSIIHGARVEIYNLRKDAEESVSAIIEFYNSQNYLSINTRGE